MNTFHARVGVLVCLVVLVAGSFAMPAQGRQAQERLRDGERPVLPGAEPALPDGGGGTTLGTAPDLSVFSVMKFAGTLHDSQAKPRTGVVGLTFASSTSFSLRVSFQP